MTKKIGKYAFFLINIFINYPAEKPPRITITKEEKTAMLFIIVKIFYLPMMINFVFGDYNNTISALHGLANAGTMTNVDFFIYIIYPILLPLFFLIDTIFFTFGYIFEGDILKNKVRSVEPTLIGWAVTLACYPPFNTYTANLLNWYSSDMAEFPNKEWTLALRIIAVFLTFIFLLSTISLGTKCSNLTNRGIVTKGPYSIIRHPAYTSKILFWWITMIPFLFINEFTIFAILSMIGWTTIYFLRAITEERHLSMDPEYVEYCKKTKYKFIPFVY